MSQLKEGSIVKLKSGGPNMTVMYLGVKGLRGHETADVGWFDESNVFHELSGVELGALELVKDDS